MASPATAESSQVAALRRQIAENGSRISQIMADLRRLNAEKATALREMREGAFCSGCNQTRSQILAKGERFPHEGQHVVAATQEQLDAKAKEYDDQIKALWTQIPQLNEQNRQLAAQATQLTNQEARARFESEQAKQRERLEQQRKENAALMSKVQEDLRKATDSRDDQAKADRDAARQRLEAERDRLQRAEQQRREALERLAAAAPPPSETEDAFQKTQSDLRAIGAELGTVAPLSPQQRAEQERLQDMARQGLVSAPPSTALDGIAVAADKTASVWDRVMEAKSAVRGVEDAFDRVVGGFGPDAATRVRMIADNAVDTVSLGDRILGQLPSAAEALTSGDARALAGVETDLAAAIGEFSGRADARARTASPAYDLLRASDDARAAASAATRPFAPPADAAERVRNYARVGRGAFETATGLRAASTPAPVTAGPAHPPVQYGGTGAGPGPLGDVGPRRFRGGEYAAAAQPAPLRLYRVALRVDNRTVTYWARTPPTPAADAPAPVSIVLPPGQAYYEGRPPASDGPPLIYLLDFDPAWVGPDAAR